jgi:hypothetical protein
MNIDQLMLGLHHLWSGVIVSVCLSHGPVEYDNFASN